MEFELLKLIPVAVGGFFSYLCVSTARSKGYDPWFWGVVGFFFGLFAIIVLSMLSDKDLEQRRSERLKGYSSEEGSAVSGDNAGIPLWKKLTDEKNQAGEGR